MRFERVEIARIRNLTSCSFELHPDINWFYGANGAGKTAILEGLHLFSSGKSFRHSEVRPLIQDQASALVAKTSIHSDRTGTSIPLQIGKTRGGETQITLRHAEQVTALTLAREFPLLVLCHDEDMYRSSAKARLKALDWGLFHVEPSFYPIWRNARQALKQRNQLLRRGSISAAQLGVWDEEFAQHCEALDALRKIYCDDLKQIAMDVWAGILGGLPELEICYRRGWSEAAPIREALRQSREADQARGYTSMGVHRADLQVRGRLGAPGNTLSRGQLKIVYWGLRIAQLLLHNQRHEEKAVCLVDDLPAELDAENQLKMISTLMETGSQLLITALLDRIPGISDRADGLNPGLFHVEHGVIQSMNSDFGAN